MPPGNPARLLKLADREFRQLTEERKTPPSANHRSSGPSKPNAARFDSGWDRKRGAADGRLSVVLTRCNESAAAP
jgi:hypothetical protein